MGVFAAIAVLGILIAVHELGHFSAARVQGIHVNRFAIGFGPILLKYQGKETEYSLRAIPLGGFVGFPDDDPDSDIPPNDPDLLRNRPIIDRAIVISAGVIANLIFAYFLLVAQASTVGIQDIQYEQGVLIPEIIEQVESPAQKAGIKAGDIIIAVGNQPLEASQNSLKLLQKTIENSPNKPLNLTIKRGENTTFLTITPELKDSGKGRIGVMLAPNGEVIRRRPHNIIEAFTVGADQFQNIINLTINGFGQLISNFQENAKQVAGPVAIVAVGAKLAENDLANLFQFGALISVNLAIINILPLPALDGGQLAFLLAEGLRGKPLPNKLQEGIMQTGLVLLLSLGVFLIVKDTTNLPLFQQLFPQ